MAASRATKFFGGCLLVSLILVQSSLIFAADKAPNGESLIPVPSTTEGNYDHQSTPSSLTDCTTQECDTGCGFGDMASCSPPGRFWIRSDYLSWWTNGSAVPPIVTTSTPGTPQNQAGVLGQPNTSVLFGGNDLFSEGRSGVRMTIGGWLDRCHRWGIQADWFSLGGLSDGYNATSFGNPILARPFYNVETGEEDAQLKAYPNVVTGEVMVDASDYFNSAGVGLRYNLCGCDSCCDPCGCETGCGETSCETSCDAPAFLNCCRTDFLVGYRHYSMGENLMIGENIVTSNLGTHFEIMDSFRTTNDFDGAELGLATTMYRGRWSLELMSKMAIGYNRQTVSIDGNTIITQGSQVAPYGVGIYATDTNIGVHRENHFNVIPQLGLEIGYQLTCHMRTYIGYNLIYWSGVKRAGEQIDMNVDPRNWAPQVAGATHFPMYKGCDSNFWAQGLNLGLEYRF